MPMVKLEHILAYLCNATIGIIAGQSILISAVFSDWLFKGRTRPRAWALSSSTPNSPHHQKHILASSACKKQLGTALHAREAFQFQRNDAHPWPTARACIIVASAVSNGYLDPRTTTTGLLTVTRNDAPPSCNVITSCGPGWGFVWGPVLVKDVASALVWVSSDISQQASQQASQPVSQAASKQASWPLRWFLSIRKLA